MPQPAPRPTPSECGNGAKAYPLDVADKDAIARVVAQIAAEFGGVDILVNNAGVSSSAPSKTMATRRSGTVRSR